MSLLQIAYRALNAHLPGVEAPAPGHPVYRALRWVPYAERTASPEVGGYRGEPDIPFQVTPETR